MYYLIGKRRLFLLFLTIFFFWGCSPKIALYDQYAYVQSTSIKVDALNVMDLAINSYLSQQKEVKNLVTEIQKLYEYDKGRSKNRLTVKQWDIMMDTSGYLLGGFLKRWKDNDSLRQTSINAIKPNISMAFDQIIKLELKKNTR